MAYHVFFLIFYNPNTGRHHHVASFPILDVILKVPVNVYSHFIRFYFTFEQEHFLKEKGALTLLGLNIPLSSSSTTSRELLPQFSTCSK